MDCRLAEGYLTIIENFNNRSHSRVSIQQVWMSAIEAERVLVIRALDNPLTPKKYLIYTS